jgi:hypothetical protein
LIQLKAETLNKIDAALRRIEEGNYSDCSECGDEIAEARLRALPFAMRCRDCEDVREATDQRERSLAQHGRPSDSVEYLLRYDTVYGRYEQPVEATGDGHLKIGNHRLQLLREPDPGRLPRKSLNVDIVFECTGAFTRREDLHRHIHAGAGYVILSAPSKGDGIETTCTE